MILERTGISMALPLKYVVLFLIFARPGLSFPNHVNGDLQNTQQSISKLSVDTVSVTRVIEKRFIDARSISVDPSGRFYVVDAARNTVVAYEKDGVEAGTFGGPGTNAGQFDEPSDMDPTNGLILNVADAGNGRIQRYSKDFRFLESIPVPTAIDQRRPESPSFRPGSERVQGLSDGRPVSIATSRADDLFVIEAGSRSVFKWDRDRRYIALIGKGPNEFESLRRPVDLMVSGDFLFVADDESKAVFVFDLFGVFRRRISLQSEENIEAIAATDESIVVVYPHEIQQYTLEGSYISTIIPRIPDDEILIDAAAGSGVIYLLSRQHLYSVLQNMKEIY